MKVLVTGGDGFIGRAVMAELKRQGHEARSFDIAECKSDDVRIPERLLQIGDHDAVIHLVVYWVPASCSISSRTRWPLT